MTPVHDRGLLAPAVVVVGPAQSGKSTLLNLLDDALNQHPAHPRSYVVPGNPDGTGRYLFHSPELRKPLKARVKGRWTQATIDTICRWIERSRERLELVLVDFGGKHDDGNDRMLRCCSHYLVLARSFEDPAREQREGMASWRTVCERNGLVAVARLRSSWRDGAPFLAAKEDGVLEGNFRADASSPGSRHNQEVVDGLVEALVDLRLPRPSSSQFDLRLDRDWTLDDLADLGGLAPDLRVQAATGRPVVLDGRPVPIWAYCHAMHLVLDERPDTVVAIVDPKVPGGQVLIPAKPRADPLSPLAAAVDARWQPDGLLDLVMTTHDRFLPLNALGDLNLLPQPSGQMPPGPIVVSGRAPVWLHLSYSRWVRSLDPQRTVGIWDARFRSAVYVHGPGTPWHELREVPEISRC